MGHYKVHAAFAECALGMQLGHLCKQCNLWAVKNGKSADFIVIESNKGVEIDLGKANWQHCSFDSWKNYSLLGRLGFEIQKMASMFI